MAVYDITNARAVVEADGKIRCINCVDNQECWKGLKPRSEILLSKEDLENLEKFYICDYCEKEL